MKQVNIYTYSTAKSPKAAKSQCEAVGFVIEYQDKPDKAIPQMKIIQGMSGYQSELYVLERALSSINTMYEIHVYTECSYVAAGFERGWLESWKTNGWKTATKKEISNLDEWKSLDEVVQQYNHKLIFHVKEDHSYRNWLKTNMEKEKERCRKHMKQDKR